MKREILFKGKRVDNGEWVKGFLMQDNFIRRKISCLRNGKKRIAYSQHEVQPETVCQSVKDDLFEDDILRSINHYEKGKPYYNYHIIQWSERFCGWFAKNKNNLGKEDTNGDVQLWVYLKNTEFEIIGNIHD